MGNAMRVPGAPARPSPPGEERLTARRETAESLKERMRLSHLVLLCAAAAAWLPAATAAPIQEEEPSGKAAPAFPGTASLYFAGRPLPVADPAQEPYRDPADQTLCAAPESLAPLGIS